MAPTGLSNGVPSHRYLGKFRVLLPGFLRGLKSRGWARIVWYSERFPIFLRSYNFFPASLKAYY